MHPCIQEQVSHTPHLLVENQELRKELERMRGGEGGGERVETNIGGGLSALKLEIVTRELEEVSRSSSTRSSSCSSRIEKTNIGRGLSALKPDIVTGELEEASNSFLVLVVVVVV